MQKTITEADLPGLADETVDQTTRMKEIIKLRQGATAKEEIEFDSWKERTVARTNSISRTLSSLGARLKNKPMYQRRGSISLPKSTPHADSF
jgi:hypothetical protein